MTDSQTEILICEALLEMMKERPYYTIKVTDLVKRIGISRSTFYVYFDSIYDVLQKIEDNYLMRFPEDNDVVAMTHSRISRNDKTLGDREANVFRFIGENMELYRALTGPNGEPSFYIRQRNRQIRIYDRILAEQLPSLAEEERTIISIFLAGGKMAVTDWWAHHSNQIEFDDFVRISLEVWCEALNSVLKKRK